MTLAVIPDVLDSEVLPRIKAALTAVELGLFDDAASLIEQAHGWLTHPETMGR